MEKVRSSNPVSSLFLQILVGIFLEKSFWYQRFWIRICTGGAQTQGNLIRHHKAWCSVILDQLEFRSPKLMIIISTQAIKPSIQNEIILGTSTALTFNIKKIHSGNDKSTSENSYCQRKVTFSNSDARIFLIPWSAQSPWLVSDQPLLFHIAVKLSKIKCDMTFIKLSP